MQTIFLTKSSGLIRRIHFGGCASFLLGVGLLALIAGAFFTGYRLAPQVNDPRPDLYAAAWQKEVEQQRTEVADARNFAEHSLDSLALRLGALSARVVRLDALGSRLVEITKLDPAEFNFKEPPGRGGVPAQALERNKVPDFIYALNQLDEQLQDRLPALVAVEWELMSRMLGERVYPAGRPVAEGWMSSKFGKRRDPVTGKKTLHKGVDYAGRRNTKIISVAAGVVVWSSRRHKYGNLVEVNHGGGFVTRYAHNAKNLVHVGDKVEKGQVLALMGSTGNSTGTHVHFEVLKDGKAVNPITFVKAAPP